MSEWSGIESAPKDGTIILLTAFEDDGEGGGPTHWKHVEGE